MQLKDDEDSQAALSQSVVPAPTLPVASVRDSENDRIVMETPPDAGAFPRTLALTSPRPPASPYVSANVKVERPNWASPQAVMAASPKIEARDRCNPVSAALPTALVSETQVVLSVRVAASEKDADEASWFEPPKLPRPAMVIEDAPVAGVLLRTREEGVGESVLTARLRLPTLQDPTLVLNAEAAADTCGNLHWTEESEIQVVTMYRDPPTRAEWEKSAEPNLPPASVIDTEPVTGPFETGEMPFKKGPSSEIAIDIDALADKNP